MSGNQTKAWFIICAQIDIQSRVDLSMAANLLMEGIVQLLVQNMLVLFLPEKDQLWLKFYYVNLARPFSLLCDLDTKVRSW